VNLKEALTVAKQEVNDLFAPDAPRDVRLETFLYDDHLAVWSLTIGFALPDHPETRTYKIVRVSEADKSVMSVRDQYTCRRVAAAWGRANTAKGRRSLLYG
jgi:hypothetical protein